MRFPASLLPRSGWVSASNLFAAGLFCLFLGVGFGAKPIAVAQVLLALAFARAFFEQGLPLLRWRALPTSAWCLSAFVLVSTLSVLANRSILADPFEQLGKLRYHAFALLILATPSLARGLLGQRWRRDALAAAWLVPLALVVGVGVVGWWTGHHPLRGDEVINARRVSGLYGQVMTFAYSIQFSFLVLAALALAPDLWRAASRVPRWVAFAGALVSGAALYLTYTRGAVLGAATGLAVLASLRSWKLLALVAAVALAGFAISRLDGSRYLDAKSDTRVGQWRAASLAFLERPVFGWGYRNFELVSASLKERYGFEMDLVKRRGRPPVRTYFQGHAHNNYLEAFASTGFAGGLSFLAFCLAWLGEARRHRFASVLVPPLAAFLVSGFFENTFFDSEVLNCVLLLYLATCWTAAGAPDGPEAVEAPPSESVTPTPQPPSA